MDFLSASRFLEGTRGRHLAATGQYRRFISPAPGTGQLSSPATAFSATAAGILIQNTAPPGSNVFVIPDFIRLLVSVASVESAGSVFQYALALDTILRYASGGLQIVTPGTLANNNGPAAAHKDFLQNKAAQSQAAVFAGAIVAAAEGANATRLCRGAMKVAAASPLAVVGDEYVWTFGAGEDVGAGFSKVGTTAATYRQNCGAGFAIGPQGSLLFHFWNASVTTAMTAEIDGGAWELAAYPA